jgi:subtilase family serine protease
VAVPDLVIYAVGAPSSAGGGDTVTVTDTTRNQGSAPSAASITNFYLSSNNTFEASDVLLGSRSIPALGTSVSNAGSTNLMLPTGLAPGTIYIIARADSGSTVSEANETNNTKSDSMAIDLPDMIVSALSVPNSALVGATISINDSTRNYGAGGAPATVTFFYLSTNGTLDVSDVLIGSRLVPALAPGAIHTSSTAVEIPPGTPPRSYSIIAKADGDGIVVEDSETNNTRYDSINVALPQ